MAHFFKKNVQYFHQTFVLTNLTTFNVVVVIFNNSKVWTDSNVTNELINQICIIFHSNFLLCVLFPPNGVGRALQDFRRTKIRSSDQQDFEN